MFTLVSLSSLLTDGVHRLPRHVRLYFFGTSDSSGPEPAEGGWEAFQRARWLRPVLVLGETYLGSCTGTGFLPGTNQTAGLRGEVVEDSLPECRAGLPSSLP